MITKLSQRSTVGETTLTIEEAEHPCLIITSNKQKVGDFDLFSVWSMLVEFFATIDASEQNLSLLRRKREALGALKEREIYIQEQRRL